MPINKITYAGHSAVFFESDDYIVAVDPWLEGNPRCPEKLKNPPKLDLIVLTHGHSDHASDTLRLATKTGAKVAATFELAMILIKEGLPENQAVAMNKGGSADIGKIHVSLTNAFHSSSYDTKEGTLYAGEPCGVVLDDGKQAIYHAGDTCLFSDMEIIKEVYKPRVALLPIGDRFTMGPRQAQRAAKFIRPEVIIPIHYKTFDMLSGTAELFIELCKNDPETKEMKIAALEPGEKLDV